MHIGLRRGHRVKKMIFGSEVDIEFNMGYWLRIEHQIKTMIFDLELNIELNKGDVPWKRTLNSKYDILLRSGHRIQNDILGLEVDIQLNTICLVWKWTRIQHLMCGLKLNIKFNCLFLTQDLVLNSKTTHEMRSMDIWRFTMSIMFLFVHGILCAWYSKLSHIF